MTQEIDGPYLKRLSIRNIFLMLLSILSIFACSTITPPIYEKREAPLWENMKERVIRIAVLPFENHTEEKGLEHLVRNSFYSQLCTKNFRDHELTEIDGVLDTVKQGGDSWTKLSPKRLGELLNTDYLVYGRVISYDKYYAGIYSQIALTVSAEMVECTTGNGIWTKTLIKRSHDGGIPFDLLGLVPAAIRSGLHMKDKRIVLVTAQKIGRLPLEEAGFAVIER